MIKHMFLFGVILPTLVTVLLFVAFLVCWFKFNMHERFFSKRKLFSKQLKHAMAPRQASLSKQSHIYTPDHTFAARAGTKDRGGGGGAGGAAGTASKGSTVSGGAGSISGKAGILSRKPRRYENCVTASATEQEDDMMHEHSVGDDPEAALCGACEDEVMHTQTMAGYSNQCASPTHSAAADDEEEDDDDDVVMEDDAQDSVARQQRTALPECSIHTTSTLRVQHPVPCSALHPQHQHQLQQADDTNHTDTEDYHTDDPDVQYVQVKQVGSMFQHTFHFPASECSHLSNSLVAGDSEDGGSEDGCATGSNYGHFVPLSQLLRDPKARHQFYAVARSRADSPASVSEFCEGSGTAGGGPPAMGVVTCTETGRLITGM